jgi:hypothetical protein
MWDSWHKGQEGDTNLMVWTGPRRAFLAEAAPLGLLGTALPAWAAIGTGDRLGSVGRAGDVVWRRPFNRDIPLPDWGPYSDHWNGIAHIADPVRGLRMDFALAPAVLRRETLVPYAEMGLAMQPIRADPELGYIAWECKLSAGVDVTLEWLAVASGGVLRATAHNRSTSSWPLLLNWIARLAPPSNPPRTRLEDASGIAHRAVKGSPSSPADVHLPDSGLWVDALHYDRLDWAEKRFDDHLVTDGRRRGEIFEDGFVGSTGIGQGFGGTAGDRVQWRLRIVRPYRAAVVRLRYRIAGGTSEFRLAGLVNRAIRLGGDGGMHETFRTIDVAIGAISAGDHLLMLGALGGRPIELDGFALVEADEAELVAFSPHGWVLEAQRQDDVAAGRTLLSFSKEIPQVYAMAWTGGTTHIGSARTDDVRTLDWALNDPSLFAMKRVPQGVGPGSVTITTPAVIDLAPGATIVRDCFIAVGTPLGAAEALHEVRARDADAAFAAARQPAQTRSGTAAYREGAERLLATIATNMLFPIWTGGTWVRNYCPGREWSSVYTWDSGFTGLGMARAAPRLSTALLDTYLSPIDDEQAAFLHHGTPLATQFYLFQELWNRNGSLTFARERYPRLARYLRFLMGREGGSTCRDLKSGLIRTYDYFYNTGGMDDYPAQMAVHAAKKTDRVAPVISSAHAIRCAKILCQVAEAIGATRDLSEWRGDIASLSEALQSHSWDEASGYYAYVVHDAAKQPTGQWRSAKGENYNMGLDGISPLVADMCTLAQVQKLIENMMTPGRLWTPYGLTAVDQRASYFSSDGYWNGTVWMPHQWFMWKALLDYGEGEKAWQIGKTALDVYSAEIERSGRTYENFDARTGIGSAWHPFGALSSPIRNWFEGYYVPGTLSVGLNTRIVHQRWSDDRAVTAMLDISGEHRATVLVVLAQPPRKASWRGQPASFAVRGERCAEVKIGPGRGILEIA